MADNAPELYLENQLCFPLYATSRLTTKLYAPYLEEMGITYPQYLVLLTLWQFGEQSVKTIGERLYLESNTLTPLLKRLEQKALLSRTRSKTDERTVVIALTPTGQELKNKAVQIPGKIVESFKSDDLTQTEIVDFQKTLFKLLGALSQQPTAGKSCD